MSKRDAEARYRAARNEAFRLAGQELSESMGDELRASLGGSGVVSIRDIDMEALRAVEPWSRRNRGVSQEWEWDEMRAYFRRKTTSRIEAAIWCDARLLALMIGGPCRHCCRVDYWEGDPTLEPPVKGFVETMVTTVAKAYCLVQKHAEIRFMEPRQPTGLLLNDLRYESVTPNNKHEQPYLRRLLD